MSEQPLSRRKARENAFAVLFSLSFGGTVTECVAQSREDEDCEYPIDAFGEDVLHLYEVHAGEIDEAIEGKLKGWRVQRLQRVSLAILRLAVAEMQYGQPGMDSVIINEAVELAKKFGDEQDYQFVNGVLGSISREKPVSGAAEAPQDGE